VARIVSSKRATSPDPSPYPDRGRRFGLELALESDLTTLYSYPGLLTNDEIQLGLVYWGSDPRDDDGVWFSLTSHFIDTETGEIIPPDDIDLDDPSIALRVILELESFEEHGGGGAPDSLWARIELWYDAAGVRAGPLGDEDDFLAALRGGEVELRSAGQTVLTGTLVPEPNTALLAGLGLTSLSAIRRRGGNRIAAPMRARV
jgi:hypothetical protein